MTALVAALLELGCNCEQRAACPPQAVQCQPERTPAARYLVVCATAICFVIINHNTTKSASLGPARLHSGQMSPCCWVWEHLLESSKRVWRTTRREHRYLAGHTLTPTHACCQYLPRPPSAVDSGARACGRCGSCSTVCWVADAPRIRFAAAKSSNGCRTSAASALPAALRALDGQVSGESLPEPCANACWRLLHLPSNLQQDIALHVTMYAMYVRACGSGSERIDAHGRSSTCSSLTRRSHRKSFLLRTPSINDTVMIPESFFHVPQNLHLAVCILQ